MKSFPSRVADLRLGAILLTLLICLAANSWADVLHVDASAGGDNNGSSWADAYTDLQAALAETEWGDEIWVAAGTYKPTNGTDRDISFVMTAGVAIYGGFAGAETDRTQRNWEANESILSGNIGDVGDNEDNSYHVIVGGNMATLDGVTITGGNGITGAGMHNDSVSPTVTNCTFSDNSVNSYGGGMNNTGSSVATVTNCTFSGNSAMYGGGMCNNNRSSTVTSCTFSGNSAANWGGGMYNTGSSLATVTNCTFSGNSADYGGGMNNSNCSPTITNCAFSGNSADEGGGMLCNGSPTVTNCIFWKNIAPMGIAEIYSTPSKPPVFSYCTIRGSGGSGALWDTSLGIDGGGNIMDDPLFVDIENPAGLDGIWLTADDGLALGAGSPCIDAGDPSSTSETDILGNQRFRTADMGSYEYQGPGPNNGVVSWVFYR